MESTCPACGKERESTDSFCRHCGAAGPDVATNSSSPTASDVASDTSGVDIEEQLREALAPSHQLIRKLGEGGMGSVFLARDPILKRMIAVKVLSPVLANDPDARKRFEREAQSVAAVSHPNIVSIFSVGELADSTPYFLMEYVSGKSLEDRIRDEGPLQMDEAKRIIGQIGSAIAAAHKAGIIHRDIKPANVLQDEESGRVLVSDFGISAILPKEDSGDVTKLTQAGMAIGTPAYMSPEQITADVVTDRTDVYSLGVLSYEILTGDGPYEISTPQEAIAAHMRDEPKRLSATRDDIDAETQTLLEACLNKDPEQRPRAEEIERRLLRGSGGLLEWPPPGLDKLTGAARRTGWLILLASVVLAIPISLGIVTLGSNSLMVPVIAMLALIGFVALSVEIFSSVRTLKSVSFEVGRGYGWLTLLEVMSDPDGRTGDLIAGTREFAGVDSPKRNALRLLRVVAASLIVVSGLLPPAVLFLLFWLGSRDLVGYNGIQFWVGGPTAFLVLLSYLFSSYESGVVRDSRRKLASRNTQMDPEGKLVQSWTDTFEVAREGQTLSSGIKGNRAAVWVIGACIALVTIAIGFSLLIVVASNFIWVVAGGVSVGGIPGSGIETYRISSLVNELRTPADPDVTTAMASQALYSIVANYDERQDFENAPEWEASPSWVIEWYEFLEDSPVDASGRAPVNLIASAFNLPLDETQSELLARVEGDPVLARFSVLARARGLDMWAVQFGSLDSPATESISPKNLPGLQYSHLYAPHQLRFLEAVARISEGDVAAAETLLKEIVSVGLLLLNEDNEVIGNISGSRIAVYGLSALEIFYRTSGRTGIANTIREALASPRGGLTTTGATSRSSQTWRDALVESAGDSTRTRGSRWWTIMELSMLPCMNIREFVFGPDPDIRDALVEARSRLVRSETEAQMFAKMTEPNLVFGFGHATTPLHAPVSWLLGKHASSCLIF